MKKEFIIIKNNKKTNSLEKKLMKKDIIIIKNNKKNIH